jgi:hypothetical protein
MWRRAQAVAPAKGVSWWASARTVRVGVTTYERLRLMGMTFRTEATIDRVEAGRLLQWRVHDRQKQLQGSRLVEPTGPTNSRFTEVVEGHLLGPLRPLEPLVARLLRRQATAGMRLKRLLEAPAISESTPKQQGI